MKPSSIAIHYAHSTWESMDSVWRKFGPGQNDSNQAIVDDPGGLICKVSSQMRDYQPPHSGNSLVSVSVCIYGTGTITMARRSVLFPTSNWCVLVCTEETHLELNVSLSMRERESQRYIGF